ncbi:unnamed protein product [Chrysodeixis includens]|uniref:Mitochondrial inner membrane protein Mpv17 n=1 Tax=Chrysodeixis includens TaxID=689277 RepID=A0A9P0C1K1_CHRIL|nr:unnamed protein product [Chrysodeixis includens]
MSGRRLFRMYQDVLRRRPYLVQAVQTSVLMAAGDVIAQTGIEKIPLTSLDISRTIRFSSIGFFVIGPTFRVWYGILAKYVGSGGSPTVTIKKVLMDQLLFAPFILFVLLALIATLKGKNLQEVKEELRLNYKDVLLTSYTIWPWVQICNFYLVPLQYQVLLVQTIALFWNTYLSWKTQRKRDMMEKKVSELK